MIGGIRDRAGLVRRIGRGQLRLIANAHGDGGLIQLHLRRQAQHADSRLHLHTGNGGEHERRLAGGNTGDIARLIDGRNRLVFHGEFAHARTVAGAVNEVAVTVEQAHAVLRRAADLHGQLAIFKIDFSRVIPNDNLRNRAHAVVRGNADIGCARAPGIDLHVSAHRYAGSVAGFERAGRLAFRAVLANERIRNANRLALDDVDRFGRNAHLVWAREHANARNRANARLQRDRNRRLAHLQSGNQAAFADRDNRFIAAFVGRATGRFAADCRGHLALGADAQAHLAEGHVEHRNGDIGLRFANRRGDRGRAAPDRGDLAVRVDQRYVLIGRGIVHGIRIGILRQRNARLRSLAHSQARLVRRNGNRIRQREERDCDGMALVAHRRGDRAFASAGRSHDAVRRNGSQRRIAAVADHAVGVLREGGAQLRPLARLQLRLAHGQLEVVRRSIYGHGAVRARLAGDGADRARALADCGDNAVRIYGRNLFVAGFKSDLAGQLVAVRNRDRRRIGLAQLQRDLFRLQHRRNRLGLFRPGGSFRIRRIVRRRFVLRRIGLRRFVLGRILRVSLRLRHLELRLRHRAVSIGKGALLNRADLAVRHRAQCSRIHPAGQHLGALVHARRKRDLDAVAAAIHREHRLAGGQRTQRFARAALQRNLRAPEQLSISEHERSGMAGVLGIVDRRLHRRFRNHGRLGRVFDRGGRFRRGLLRPDGGRFRRRLLRLNGGCFRRFLRCRKRLRLPARLGGRRYRFKHDRILPLLRPRKRKLARHGRIEHAQAQCN